MDGRSPEAETSVLTRSRKEIELEPVEPSHTDDDDDVPFVEKKGPSLRLRALIITLLVLCLGGFSVSQWWSSLPNSRPRMTNFCTTGDADSPGASGKTNGLDRRQLSGPAWGTPQPNSAAYCEEVYKSSLGKAMPDCTTGKLQAPSRANEARPWWKRWGGSSEEAVSFLVSNLSPSEKEGLVQGFGWDGYNILPGLYVGGLAANRTARARVGPFGGTVPIWCHSPI